MGMILGGAEEGGTADQSMSYLGGSSCKSVGGRKLFEAVVAEGSGDMNGPGRSIIPRSPPPGLFFTSWKKIERKMVLTKKVKKLKAISYFPPWSARTQGVRVIRNLVEPTEAGEVPLWRESWRK